MPLAKRTVAGVLSLIVCLAFAPLQFFQSLWCRFMSSGPFLPSLAFMATAYAETLSTVEEALQLLLPAVDDIKKEIKTISREQIKAIQQKAGLHLDPVYDNQFQFFIGEKNGEVAGYAASDTVRGKWGPIHYMLAFTPSGEVKDVIILEYQERRGRPVAKKRFLKQFKGKSVKDPIRFMRDIRGVTGASISSRGMSDGIRKMVHVFKAVYDIKGATLR